MFSHNAPNDARAFLGDTRGKTQKGVYFLFLSICRAISGVALEQRNGVLTGADLQGSYSAAKSS
jgi:hypothetical protein